MSDLSQLLESRGASAELIEFAADKSTEAFWDDCTNGQWMLLAACSCHTTTNPADVAKVCCSVARMAADTLNSESHPHSVEWMGLTENCLNDTASASALALAIDRTELKASQSDSDLCSKLSLVEHACAAVLCAKNGWDSNSQIICSGWLAESANACHVCSLADLATKVREFISSISLT